MERFVHIVDRYRHDTIIEMGTIEASLFLICVREIARFLPCQSFLFFGFSLIFSFTRQLITECTGNVIPAQIVNAVTPRQSNYRLWKFVRLETMVIINTRPLWRAMEPRILDDHGTNNNDYFISINLRKLNSSGIRTKGRSL